MDTKQKTFLHVGCGTPSSNNIPLQFQGWEEIRLDIDPAVKPDIVADIRDMKEVASAAVDGLYSSHNLEHLYAYEVPRALKEFYRVLKPGGLAMIRVPNLEEVARHIIDTGLETPLIETPSGPISAMDIIFGWQVRIANGNHFMCHKTGFTPDTFCNKLLETGFIEILVRRIDYPQHPSARWDMEAMAYKIFKPQ